MKKRKWSFTDIFYNNRALMAISLLIAVIGWVVVITVVDPEGSFTLEDQPVDMERQAASVTQLGLNPILLTEEKISVEVEGKLYIIGGLDSDDITVYARMSNITEPGTYTVDLGYVINTDKEFTVKSLKPNRVTVRFDRMSEKEVPITAEIANLNVPEGYVKDQEVVTPGTIKVTGPEADVERIDHCVVRVDASEISDQTRTLTGEVTPLDAAGNVIESPYLRMDYDVADVTIPILQKKTVELKIGFLHTPPNFDLDTLDYTLSNQTMEIAGSKKKMETYSELVVGYVDFNQLDIGSNFVFDITLPSGVVNIDNVNSVSVEFNNEDMISRNFVVREINVLNQPVNYDVSVSTSQINNVRVIGPRDVVNALTAEDLVADVDLSSVELATGQFSVPVTIYAPAQSDVWVNGEYQVMLVVNEQ